MNLHLSGKGRRRAAGAWVLLAVAAAGCSVPVARPGNLDVDPDADALAPGYVAPAPAQVLHDVAYGPGPAQLADVYRPAAPRVGSPVILYLHGGGWVGGDRSYVPSFVLRQGSRMGAVVVSAGYTLASATDPATAFPASSRDADRVVRWIKQQAPTWGNAPRVVAIGPSAGGHLGLLAALAPGQFVDPGLPPDLAAVSPRLSGIVSLAGPVDIEAMYAIPGWRPAVLEPYLGCSPCSGEQVLAASPLRFLGSAPVPPVYLAYGSADWLIPPDVHGLPTAIRLMLARGDETRDVGDRAIWYELVGDDHDIDGAHLNVRSLELWLDFVAEGRWPVPGA